MDTLDLQASMKYVATNGIVLNVEERLNLELAL